MPYPDETCRNCEWAQWTWSRKPYPEGKPRIIVQRPGQCTASASKAGGLGKPEQLLRAQAPLTDCFAWRLRS
jgi:hypothetical protein